MGCPTRTPTIRAAPPPCFPGADPARFDALEREWWRNLVRDVFATLGAYSLHQSAVDLVTLYVFGLLGFLMRRFGFKGFNS